MTDRLAEQGAVQYAQANPTSAGVSRLGGAGALQAAIANAIDNGRSNATASRLGGLGRIYALAAASAFTPASLFAGVEVGAWYDYPDNTNLYQDSNGTTAVSAAGQVLGLVFDKSKSLTLGTERLGDLTILQPRNANSSLISETSSEIVVDSLAGGTYGVNAPTVTGVVGTSYWINITLLSSVTRVFTVAIGAGAKNITLSAGVPSTQLFLVTSTATTALDVYAAAGAAGERLTVTALSVKSIAGNHAVQATTGNKPLWQTTYAEFDAFDDHLDTPIGGGGTTGFLFAAAIRPSGTGTARTLWSDTGTNTGYKVHLDTSDRLVLSAGNGTAYTSAVRTGALTDGTDYVVMAWHDGTNLNVSVNNGAATQEAFATATAGTAAFVIGSDNGAATGPFGARIYGVVYRKNDASTEAERTSVASYLASKGGVTL